MKKTQFLIIGLQYPEPQSTAAGTRMMQLIQLFIKYGYDLYFATSHPKNKHSVTLEKFGVKVFSILLNDIKTKVVFQQIKPDIVLFDRYLAEEQFGWLVDEVCPMALKILDTEDLHFLRENRELLLKKSEKIATQYALTEKAKRELAAIYRCDISLVISEVEMHILQYNYSVPKNLLFYLPFIFTFKSLENKRLPVFEERKHFMSIGNFKHKPNMDMVMHFYKNHWLGIQQALPKTQWHIYGAYVPEQIMQIHNTNKGVIVKGRAENALETLQKYRVMLAPIRFGAGLKGKCLDSMMAGTPSVTSSIGAEGIAKAENWPGFVTDDSTLYCQKAVQLYQNKKLWKNKQNLIDTILQQRFKIDVYLNQLQALLNEKLANLDKLRRQNTIGEILKHHHHKSTKYMSLWIQEKNK